MSYAFQVGGPIKPLLRQAGRIQHKEIFLFDSLLLCLHGSDDVYDTQ